MSSQNNKGVWVISEKQAREFLDAPIDYNQLVNDCLTVARNKTKKLIKGLVVPADRIYRRK